jgi:hypothetical protein
LIPYVFFFAWVRCKLWYRDVHAYFVFICLILKRSLDFRPDV